LMILRLSH